ncbi:MAG: anhydro-N-acetylmuramic acid kinase [Pseudomonadales bacterium]|nr:anhydro-N-acetylmuramic acid kinase [Pseudomonadales bacterium]
MHKHISHLYKLANKPERLIIGLMSGTSLDGLDIVLCKISAHGADTKIDILAFETIDYDADFRDRVKPVFSKRDIDLEHLCLLNPWIGLRHANMVLSCLNKWQFHPQDIDLIASHGQTIYHSPKNYHQRPDYPNATLQIGDGDHIAHTTGITTISDFRQKHIAAGGEGAPLAMYGDYLVFSSTRENRIMLNIGGIANITWLPHSQDSTKVLSSDIGPGNTLMDALVQLNMLERRYDNDSLLARSGSVNETLLAALKSDDFFALPFPKTIGPELFNLRYLERAQASSSTLNLALNDQLATLNRFTADTIVKAILDVVDSNEKFAIYASGGGIYNSLLMDNIRAQLVNVPIDTTQALKVAPDAKEAVLFAILANECVAGKGHQLGSTNLQPITMGKISFPD